MTPLETRWDTLLKGNDGPFYQRVDDSHPLDLYIGKESSGEPALLLVTSQKPPPSHEYQAIHLLSRTRTDQKWALVLKLVKPELSKIFFLLCDDLIQSCKRVVAGEASVDRFLARFTRWQRLLDRGHDGLLSESALRGLMGELLFLLHHLLPDHEPLAAVTAWTGPMGADQDFSFSDHLFEIKTARSGAPSVVISSAEQLDTAAASKPLDLAVMELDDAEASTPDAITPLSLVDRLTAFFETSPDALELFMSLLVEAGFVRREEYGNRHYLFRGIRQFEVTADFPSIVRSGLPAGIGKVSYEIELKAVRHLKGLSTAANRPPRGDIAWNWLTFIRIF